MINAIAPKTAPKTSRFISTLRRNRSRGSKARGGRAGEAAWLGNSSFFAKIYREFWVKGLLRRVTALLTFLMKCYRALKVINEELPPPEVLNEVLPVS
jgi:hypothetical protein